MYISVLSGTFFNLQCLLIWKWWNSPIYKFRHKCKKADPSTARTNFGYEQFDNLSFLVFSENLKLDIKHICESGSVINAIFIYTIVDFQQTQTVLKNARCSRNIVFILCIHILICPSWVRSECNIHILKWRFSTDPTTLCI